VVRRDDELAIPAPHLLDRDHAADVLGFGLLDRLALPEELVDLSIVPALDGVRRVGIGEVVHRPEQRCGGETPRLPNLHRDHVVSVGLEVHPHTLGGDELGRVELAAREVDRVTEVDTWRTGELADDNPLGFVDQEGALGSHGGDLAHVHLGLANLAALFVDQANLRAQGALEGDVPLATLLEAELRLP